MNSQMLLNAVIVDFISERHPYRIHETELSSLDKRRAATVDVLCTCCTSATSSVRARLPGCRKKHDMYDIKSICWVKTSTCIDTTQITTHCGFCRFPTAFHFKTRQSHVNDSQMGRHSPRPRGLRGRHRPNCPEVAQDWFSETSSIWYHATSQPSRRVSASTLIQMWRAEGQGSGT